MINTEKSRDYIHTLTSFPMVVLLDVLFGEADGLKMLSSSSDCSI